MVLNQESKRKIKGKEIERNMLVHRQFLTYTTMSIVYIRDGFQLSFFCGRKLFQQFVVDVQANYEQKKLNWARTYQYTLRFKLYQGLQDAIMHNRHNGKNNRPLGCKLILSFSHVGSFRFMTQLFQDTIAIFFLFKNL